MVNGIGLAASFLMLVSGSVFAGEPPLLFDFSAAPQRRNGDGALRDRLAVEGTARKVVAITLNRAALRGNLVTVTVTVNGYAYRFAGTPHPHDADGVTWVGFLNNTMADQLTISVNDGPEGGISGSLNIGEKNYSIHGTRGSSTVFLVERVFTDKPHPIDQSPPMPKAAVRP